MSLLCKQSQHDTRITSARLLSREKVQDWSNDEDAENGAVGWAAAASMLAQR